MIRKVDYSVIDAGEVKGSYILVDVRSPGEYEKATIPGAINIPIFSDEERENIGTVYVRESTDKAKAIGVEVASKKLPIIFDKIQSIQREYKNIILFCERGGMRSTSLVAFLSSLGVNVFKLTGGYKGYRGFINENLPKIVEKIKFVVLHGNTGVGKTKLLKELQKNNIDMLDLEGCANNRGSLFGDVGLGKTNSQKKFESLIYDSLKNRKSDLVFVEAESKRIGHTIIPDHIFLSMKNGEHIDVEASLEARINNIIEDYVHDNSEELIDHIKKLSRYISEENIKSYIEGIKNGEYEKVIENLMIKYYDPMYQNKVYNYLLTVDNTKVEEASSSLINWIKENKKI